jgi:glutathione S-transferase
MTYTLYYHTKCEQVFGRAWGLYAMLKHAGKDFTCKAPDEVPAGIGFAVPVLTSPTGWSIAQSNAITMALGKELGLAPGGGAIADAKAAQLVADAGDFTSEIAAAKPDERIMAWLTYIEGQMQGDYFMGELSFVDFAFYPPFVNVVLKKGKGKMAGVSLPPKIQKFVNETMPAIIAVAEMNASGVAMLPDYLI